MTAAQYLTLATEAAEQAATIQGVTEQALLRGVVAATETFGLTQGQDRLIAKLRAMNPTLRAELLTERHTP